MANSNKRAAQQAAAAERRAAKRERHEQLMQHHKFRRTNNIAGKDEYAYGKDPNSTYPVRESKREEGGTKK